MRKIRSIFLFLLCFGGFANSDDKWVMAITSQASGGGVKALEYCNVTISNKEFSAVSQLENGKLTISGTWKIGWKGPNHDVAQIKIIGIRGEEVMGKGNVVASDSDGNPTMILIITELFGNSKDRDVIDLRILKNRQESSPNGKSPP